MSKVLNCGEFKLQSHYHVLLGMNIQRKGTNSPILPDVAQIVSLLFFYKDSFRINWPTKVLYAFNKETKLNYST